jgi:hypothetical protein
MADEQKSPEQKPTQAQPLTTLLEVFDRVRREAEYAADHYVSVVHAVNKSTDDAATFALRMIIIINGGAAVSLLAFVGGMVSQGRVTIGPQLNALAITLVWFAAGVAVGTLASGFVYLYNFAFLRAAVTKTFSPQRPFILESPKSKRWVLTGTILRWTASLLALASIALFTYGMFQVYLAVVKLAG